MAIIRRIAEISGVVTPRTRAWTCALWVVLTAVLAGAADFVREPIDEGLYASVRQGRRLFLQCTPTNDPSTAKAYLGRYLADPGQWKTYAVAGMVAIPFEKLNDATRRTVLLTIFKDDVVDERGWRHTVRFEGQDQETLWSLCEWLTGKGSRYEQVIQLNALEDAGLRAGQKILIPRGLLLDVMKKPTVTPVEPALPELEAPYRPSRNGDLEFVTKDGKQYAVYRLKKGEAPYTSVIVRFTDFQDNGDIMKAWGRIQKASSIKDVRSIRPGTRILIPVDMLSAQYMPEGSPERQQYEEVIQEAQRLRGQVSAKGLEGVVVILDPGHGGKDQGASAGAGLYEDEFNYDVACRIKLLLETQTSAKAYITMRDPSQGYKPTEVRKFVHDTDEEVLTTPAYPNAHWKTSANLRWYLANSIYRKEVKAGVDRRKVVFTSIHTDELRKELRGAMVYIPGAQGRRSNESRPKPHSTYNRYAEVREQPTVTTTASERKRDEALSRNFAVTVINELGKHRIKRFDQGDAIRSVIHRSKTKTFVPTVLRNCIVPTKVLIEMANIANAKDSRWLSDPWWRQQFAEAYVSALKKHYGS